MPYICYMENLPFGSPIPSISRRLIMAHFFLSSPDPLLAASNDSVITTLLIDFFSVRINAAVLSIYSEQLPTPTINFITFSDACVFRIQKNYSSDISDKHLALIIGSNLFFNGCSVHTYAGLGVCIESG